MLSPWALLALAFFAGAALATQAGVNATLGRGLGSAVHAALVSFLVGTLALAAVALARKEPVVAASTLRAIPLWAWFGGILGAFVVASAITLAPRLGAAAFLAAIIAGQLATALVLDHYGWVGFVERAITWPRIAGVALVGLGAVLLRWG